MSEVPELPLVEVLVELRCLAEQIDLFLRQRTLVRWLLEPHVVVYTFDVLGPALSEAAQWAWGVLHEVEDLAENRSVLHGDIPPPDDGTARPQETLPVGQVEQLDKAQVGHPPVTRALQEHGHRRECLSFVEAE